MVLTMASAGSAEAEPPSPELTLSARETVDLWDDPSGGARGGAVVLNKLQVSAGLRGERFGLDGLIVHGEVFRTDGASLSSRLGDIQTASNIEAVPTFRLFEGWIEKRFGDEDRSFAIRAGLMDLNSDFDSIETASLFINSSHGIGPDLSRSGRNGPSIFPVSAAGLRASWLPSKPWTLRIAAFDGVPGNTDRPKGFVAVKLRGEDGILLVAQTDYHLSDSAKVEVGAWGYSTAMRPDWPGANRRVHDRGVYASFEGPLPGVKGVSGWLRAGRADVHAQSIGSYLGAGIAARGTFAARPDDRFGIAVARAGIAGEARKALGISRAETNLETSYQHRISEALVVQPDLQWVHHPSGVAGARDALIFGLRIVLTAAYPRQASPSDAANPNLPAGGPQPPDSRERFPD